MMERVLIVFASSYGQTRAIAEAIARRLRDRGCEVHVADLAAGRLPSPSDYDVVVIGSRVHFGTHARSAVAYIHAHLRELDERPTYFFSVSGRAASEPQLADPGSYIRALVDQTRLRPRRTIAIAGGIPYRKYNPLLRQIMKVINRRSGHSTDTRHDHELTDWDQVRTFADAIAEDQVARPDTAIASRT